MIKNINLVTPGDPRFQAATELIEQTYQQAFQASIRPRPDLILALSESEGEEHRVVACMTLAHGEGRPFFSERYLGERAETAIGRILALKVDRSHILEVGGLASRLKAAGAQLMCHAPWFVLGLGYRFGLLTATRQVRYLTRMTGMPFTPMAKARKEALPEPERPVWGSYYDHDPFTGVIDLHPTCQTVAAQRAARYAVRAMSMSVQERAVAL